MMKVLQKQSRKWSGAMNKILLEEIIPITRKREFMVLLRKPSRKLDDLAR